MATRVVEEPAEKHVVHEHRYFSGDGNGAGFILGIVLLLALILLFFYYGLPYVRSLTAPQVNIPDRVNVNIDAN